MSRFQKIMEWSHLDDEEERADLEDQYEDMLACGFGASEPINWFTSQGIRPDLMKLNWALSKGILVEGQLPPTLTQMIVLTISRHNSCRYCSVTHSRALESMGVPEQVIEACVADSEFSDLESPQCEVLRFAVKAARDPNSITDEDTQTLRDAGLQEGEILEIFMLIGFTKYINTWADLSGVAVDTLG